MAETPVRTERRTHDDVVILVLEMQPPIVAFSRTHPEADLRRAAAVTTRIATAFDLPLFASTVALGESPAELIPELAQVDARPRSSVSPFGDPAIRLALEQTGRRTLAIGGVSSEIAILHAVLDARREGYDVHLLADLCGGLSARTEATAFGQMEAAGATLSNISSFFTGLVADMGSSDWQALSSALGQLWSWDNAG